MKVRTRTAATVVAAAGMLLAVAALRKLDS